MFAAFGLIVILALSMLVVRVGSIALQMTGLSRDTASFQALSAFSGAGFTTREAESILAHPVRRQVATTLIRLGNVGIISAMATLVLSFMDSPNHLDTVAVLVAGSIGMLLLSRSRHFSAAINPVIRRLLGRIAGLDVRDYTGLLHLYGDYRIVDFPVTEHSWLAAERIRDLELRSKENVVVLGIRRDDEYVGAPSGDDELQPGDTVVAYGRESELQEVIGRTKEGHHLGDLSEEERRFDVQSTFESPPDTSDG